MEGLIDYDTSTLDQDFIARLGNKEQAAALVRFVDHIHDYKQTVQKIHAIHAEKRAAVINNITKINGLCCSAEQIGVSKLTARGIQDRINDLQEKWQLWQENRKAFQEIGGPFAIQDSDNLHKIDQLIALAEEIAALPRDYLCLRTEHIIAEAAAPCLKELAEAQERIQAQLQDHETRYDLSSLGSPKEINSLADVLDNAGFFAFS